MIFEHLNLITKRYASIPSHYRLTFLNYNHTLDFYVENAESSFFG